MESYKKDTILFHHIYCKVYWNDNSKILIAVWEVPIILIDAEFRKSYLAFLIQIEKYKPHSLLIDVRKSRMTLNQSDYKFFKENCSDGMGEKLKKTAWIVSENVYSQISYELYLDKLLGKRVELQFFHAEIEALKWLKNIHK